MEHSKWAAIRASRAWPRFAHLVPREQPGSIIVLTALMMVAMMGFVGLTIDVGHQMTKYRQAQNASDAAALAAAYNIYSGGANTISTATLQAKVVVQQNGFTINSLTTSSLPDGDLKSLLFCVDSDCTTTTTNPQSVGYVKAVVGSSFSTYFIGVLGFKVQSVTASAIAQVEAYQHCQACILDPTGNGALTVSGGGVFTTDGVKIAVNSCAGACSSGNAIGGSGVINETNGSVISVGTYSGNITINGTVTTGSPPVPDPLAYLPPPGLVNTIYTTQTTSCNAAGTGGDPCYYHNDTSTNNVTVGPGIYDKLEYNGSGTLTLLPGIYVITGDFNVTAQASIVGNGVTLYIGCSGSGSVLWTQCTSTTPSNKMGYLKLAGGGTVNLSAMTRSDDTIDPVAWQEATLGACPANPYPNSNPPATSYCYPNLSDLAGILIYQDRLNSSSMTITGSSSITNSSSIVGSIYAKGTTTSSPVKITGGGSAQMAVDSLLVVGDLTLNGNSGGFNMTYNSDLNAKAAPPSLWR